MTGFLLASGSQGSMACAFITSGSILVILLVSGAWHLWSELDSIGERYRRKSASLERSTLEVERLKAELGRASREIEHLRAEMDNVMTDEEKKDHDGEVYRRGLKDGFKSGRSSALSDVRAFIVDLEIGPAGGD